MCMCVCVCVCDAGMQGCMDGCTVVSGNAMQSSSGCSTRFGLMKGLTILICVCRDVCDTRA